MSVAFTASTREVLQQIVRDARFQRLTQIPLLASMPILTIVGAYVLFAVATYLWLQGELPLVAMLLLNGFAIYAAFTPLHDATHRTVSRSPRAKLAVWEHNSHLGDARATDMGQRGELNVRQLTREKYGRDAVLVGFTTHHGTVTAASEWGGVAERKRVRPALPGSYEAMFHTSQAARFPLIWSESELSAQALRDARLQRAIGVIYRPETERQSHYFKARLPDQFDAVLHFDETRAVEPLEYTSEWEEGEVPEIFPFAV